MWYIYIIGTSTTKQDLSISFPVLILPEFHSVRRCEGRKCIVLGLCNASLLLSLSQFLLLILLLFVPQYGRLAAILELLALNHSACLRSARRISYSILTFCIFTSAEQTSNNPLSIFPPIWICLRDVLHISLYFLNLTFFALSCYQFTCNNEYLVCVYICMYEGVQEKG